MSTVIQEDFEDPCFQLRCSVYRPGEFRVKNCATAKLWDEREARSFSYIMLGEITGLRAGMRIRAFEIALMYPSIGSIFHSFDHR
jgi:hypothetical protein